MKVLLIGKNGMLGSCLLKHLAGLADFEMYATGREELDIADFDAVQNLFKRISPDFVLNCAAFTAVDACEDQQKKEEVFRINAKASGVLAKACKEQNAVLVHFSTDYVFDGKKAEGYKEDAETSPLNAYGQSKLEGEDAIQAVGDQFYIVRTSWLYGEGGKNFVDTMLKLGQECLEGKREKLKVVDDQIGSPTFTADLVRMVIDNFMTPYLSELPTQHEKRLKLDSSSAEVSRADSSATDFGIYHFSNSGSCSWHQFACEIFRLREMEVEVDAVTSGEFKSAAARPRFSILVNTKLPKARSWKEALEAYLL